MTKPPAAPNSARKPPSKPKKKSRLQRLSRWLPKAARRAGRRVRGLRGSFGLELLANVTRHGPGRFQSDSNDPQLSVIPRRTMPIGWVQLALRVFTKPNYPFAPQLFYDTGEGWSDAESVRLPAPVDGKLTAFLRLPAGIRRLRLDVGHARGEFRLLSLRMWEISGPEAWLMHLARVGVGLQSWHPSHPWERRAELIAIARGQVSPTAGAGPSATNTGTERELQLRAPQLALYASEENEARTRAAQRGHGTVERAPAVMDQGVSVLILNLDKPELILPLIDRLAEEQRAFAARGLRLQVIVGDTGSKDERVVQRLGSLPPDMLVQLGLKYHFSRCNNTITHLAACDTLLFLNNDVIFPEGRACILEMYDLLHARPDRGIVGCCLFYEDRLVQHMGVDFLRDAAVRGLCFHPQVRTKVDAQTLRGAWRVPAVTGACLMIRHGLYAEVGGMDEAYAAECQDIALCLAVDRLGYETYIAYAGEVLHLENATRPKGEENWPDRQRFLRRWGGYIEARFL
jgi:GT2 family glycosyltransferase